jgi:hypothetical protein
MPAGEMETLRKLKNIARDAARLFSNRAKADAERMVCAAFLRCLGTTFRPAELVKARSDPPDVLFRHARFEVMLLLDEDRQPHKEWKKIAEVRRCASSVSQVLQPVVEPVRLKVDAVAKRVIDALSAKSGHYDPRTLRTLDALVYVDLIGRVLYPPSDPLAVPNDLTRTWRSICFLFPPYSCVVYATDAAPALLRQYSGQIRSECLSDAILVVDRLFEV